MAPDDVETVEHVVKLVVVGGRASGKSSLCMMDPDDVETVEHVVKLVVVGDGASGKSSLCTRFAQDAFGKHYRQTVGLDFFLKRLSFANGTMVTLQVWDIGGQTLGGPMLDKYIYGAHGALLVYDITNYASFENLQDWIRCVQKFAGNPESDKRIHLALVANKTDLEHLKTVTVEKHVMFAEKNGMSSHYVSAKSGDTVRSAFQKIAADICGITLTTRELDEQIETVKAAIPVQESSIMVSGGGTGPGSSSGSSGGLPSGGAGQSNTCSVQ